MFLYLLYVECFCMCYMLNVFFYSPVRRRKKVLRPHAKKMLVRATWPRPVDSQRYPSSEECQNNLLP